MAIKGPNAEETFISLSCIELKTQQICFGQSTFSQFFGVTRDQFQILSINLQQNNINRVTQPFFPSGDLSWIDFFQKIIS